MNIYIIIGPVLFVLYLVYVVFDNYFLSVEEAQAKVYEKSHDEAKEYSITTYNAYRVPYTRKGISPESFFLKMQILGKETLGAVSKEIFDKTNIGDTVTVSYCQKRFSGKVIVKDVKI